MRAILIFNTKHILILPMLFTKFIVHGPEKLKKELDL